MWLFIYQLLVQKFLYFTWEALVSDQYIDVLKDMFFWWNSQWLHFCSFTINLFLHSLHKSHMKCKIIFKRNGTQFCLHPLYSIYNTNNKIVKETSNIQLAIILINNNINNTYIYLIYTKYICIYKFIQENNTACVRLVQSYQKKPLSVSLSWWIFHNNCLTQNVIYSAIMPEEEEHKTNWE